VIDRIGDALRATKAKVVYVCNLVTKAGQTSGFTVADHAAEIERFGGGGFLDAVLYNRLTDAKNHYYAYLYTALFIKEIEAQWQHAGFSISDNPGAIVTLFNLGFSKSEPKSDPVIAGAPITSGGRTYVYGELGRLFYTSNELLDIFPRVQ
jgi:hypothetical protein